MHGCKTLIALLAILATTGHSADVRHMAGRIIDVTQAAAAGPRSAYSNYWITGDILATYPNITFLEHDAGTRYFKMHLPPSVVLTISGDNTEMRYLLIAGRCNNTNGWTTAQFDRIIMPYESRKYFEARQVKTVIGITNFSQPDLTGKLTLLAFPSGSQTFTLPGGTSKINTFDVGTPYILAENTNKYLHTLTPTGLRQSQFK